MKMRALWLTKVLDFISPRQCVVCGARLSATERSVCTVCMLHLPRTGFHLTPSDNPMAQLFWHLAPVHRAAALFYYEPHSAIARLVYQLKYGHRPDIGQDMGRVMAVDMLPSRYFDDVDLLVPVPLAGKRLHQRGYNQSHQLALGISQVTHLPVDTRLLTRRRFQQSQTQLNRQERQSNVADTFEVHDGEQLTGLHVLLVDDVCTTGATLIACANALSVVPRLRISVLTLGFTKS